MDLPVDLSPPAPTLGRRLRAAWLRLRFGAEGAWSRALRSAGRRDIESLWATRTPATSLDEYHVFRALDFRNPRFLAAILACGASPNQQHRNNHFDYPLHRAAARAQHAHLAVLLAAGADTSVLDGNGYTPLAVAINGFSECSAAWKIRRPAALALLDAGADPAAWVWNDRESMLAMVPADDTELLERFLAGGADPAGLLNPDPGKGLAALNRATRAHHLLQRAAELPTPQAIDRFLGWMEAHGHGPATRFDGGRGLAAHLVGHWPEAAHAPADSCYAQVLDLLERRRHDLGATDAQGNTLLHVWAQSSPGRQPWMAQWGEALLSHPRLVPLRDRPNHAGLTPLDLILARPDLADAPWLAPCLSRLRMHRLDTRLPSPAPAAAPVPRSRL